MVLDGEDLSFLMEMLGGVGVKVHPVIAVKALFCVVWNIFFDCGGIWIPGLGCIVQCWAYILAVEDGLRFLGLSNVFCGH